MMSDEDIKEYHNIGKAIKLNEKYNYVDATRVEEHGSRTYDILGARLPSVTTILGRTKNQQFLKDWKEKVGEQEAERIKNLSTILLEEDLRFKTESINDENIIYSLTSKFTKTI